MKQSVLCIAFAVIFTLISNTYAQSQEPAETSQRRFTPEIGVLAEFGFLYGSVEFTGNIRNRNNDVFGVNIGKFDAFMDDDGETKDKSTTKYCLHYRHYFPFGKRNRLAFYPDVTWGPWRYRRIEMNYIEDPENPEIYNYTEEKKVSWDTFCTIRMGLSIRMLRESRFSFGAAVTPDIMQGSFLPGMYIEFTI